MSFFIKGKTRCSICNTIISDRKDAVVLPYIAQDSQPDLIKYIRTFAHRDCFTNWNYHKAYSEAAFQLIKLAYNEGKLNDVLYCNNYLLITKKGMEVKVEDSFYILEFQIELGQIEHVIDGFEKLIHEKLPSFTYRPWQIKHQQQNFIYYELDDSAIIDEVPVDKIRLQDWVEALRHICNHSFLSN